MGFDSDEEDLPVAMAPVCPAALNKNTVISLHSIGEDLIAAQESFCEKGGSNKRLRARIVFCMNPWDRYVRWAGPRTRRF